MKPIEVNKKSAEEVQFWDYQEVKKSKLSPNAKSKIISKSGSNYVSENKEDYGPCGSCGNSSITFKLTIVLDNFAIQKGRTVYSVDDAREEASDIIAERGHWTDRWFAFFSAENRQSLVNKINYEINRHINYGENVNKVVVSNE